MKIGRLRSIQAQLLIATMPLIIGIVAVLMWLSMTTEQRIYREQKRATAVSFARTLADAWSNELGDENWNQIRVGIDRLVRESDEMVYAIVSDSRLSDRIIASAPKDFLQHYVPDIVPSEVTQTAWSVKTEPIETETYLLRDVVVEPNIKKGARGERVLEVVAAISPLSDGRLGAVRVGVSLEDVDAAMASAIQRAVIVGGFSLLLGLVGAWYFARRLAARVRRLQTSAARIARGDLDHRVADVGADELGALSSSFNEMTQALQVSFGTLERTLHSFERFVPEKFLGVIAPEGIENIAVGVSASRTITILFSDIRGFTSMSESMTPQEIFDFLNDYLSRMGTPITEMGGFIDKYIGDAIMALFDGDFADDAIRAALGMHAALSELNVERAKTGLAPIEIGVGLHRGDVVMGTVGSADRIDSTVVGDAVNLASRVEGLTKRFRCGVLLTEDVAAALLNEDDFRLKIMDAQVKVPGKDDPIAVYHVRSA